MLVIAVLLVKKAVIGKRLAHVVKKAQIMELIHAGFVVVITQVVQTTVSVLMQSMLHQLALVLVIMKLCTKVLKVL